MGIVVKRLLADLTEFISLFELLYKIVEHDDCTLQQASDFLNSTFSEEAELGKFIGWRQRGKPLSEEVTNDEEEYLLWVLLADVSRCDEHSDGFTAYTFEDIDSNNERAYHRYGFNRAAIFELLKKNDLNLEDELETPLPGMPMSVVIETPQLKRWPWGSHHTDTLGHLEAAAERFWVNYDPTDATTAPTNSDVSNWLQKNKKISKAKANSIASMLRPDDLPTGPRK